MAALLDTVYHVSEEFLSLCMIIHSIETIFSPCQSLCRFASSHVLCISCNKVAMSSKFGTFFVKGISYVPKFGESGLGVGWG